MKKIYETKEWKGFGKHEFFHNEYVQDKDTITKFKCGRRKIFNGKENEWTNTKRKEASWKKSDPKMPDWLKKHVK